MRRPIVLLAILALSALGGDLNAQVRTFPAGLPARLRRAPIAAPAASAPASNEPADAATDLAEARFPGGAALKTDPQQQRLLQRAEQCVADGRLDLAIILWQRVLDEAGDTLMTHDGRTYTSLAAEVEATLSTLDARGLQTYRITADGEVQALLSKAGDEGREAALAQVVRRYFISSHGDDAAFELGCLALDRYDFVGAARMFRKILERHPDPSIPRGELLLRLAVANSRAADRGSAEEALKEAAVAPGARPSQEILSLVAEQIAAASSLVAAAQSTDWPMALGGAERSRHMAGLPIAATSRTLAELWVQQFSAAAGGELSAQNPASGFEVHLVMSGRVRPAQQPMAETRERMVSQWRQNGWRPAQQLLFDGDRVYCKSADALFAYSTAANSDQPLWRSVWMNRYQLDGMSQMRMAMAANMGLQLAVGSEPSTTTEVLLFGDRVHQSMSIADGVVYSIEGQRFTKEAEGNPSNPRGFQWGVTPRRTRTNWLAAYEARSGKARWHRGASDEDKESTQDVGFLAAPVPFGNHLLLAPVTDGGTIYLYALRPSDGSTVWKSYLCDEPAGGCSPWSQVQIAVDGRDAYVSCGAGVVFAVDAVSGGVLWAVRYERAGEPDSRMRQMYGQQSTPQLILDGWDDDVVIPHGRLLVVMASDSDRLFALDRQTGELLWDSPRTPGGDASAEHSAEYCLGVHGRSLFVAGKNVVRRYDMPTGLMKADVAIDDSFGRGVLTTDAIYMPVKDSIVKLDLEQGKELGQVGVSLTTDDPVGNLYSDGEKLWVTGGDRVYAMTNLEHRLRLLEEQVTAGDYEAQFNRMRLYAKQNKLDLAFDDLRGGYQLSLKSLEPDKAIAKLLDSIGELQLSSQRPLQTVQLIADLFTGNDAVSPGKAMADRRSQLIVATLHALRGQKPAGTVAQVLRLAPLLDQDHLLTAAAQTVDSVATADNRLQLLTAIGNEAPASQLLALPALARIAPEVADQPLRQLAQSADDRVRLAAARALLNRGDRAMLDVLVALLESDDSRVRFRSHQTLRAVSGERIPFAPGGNKEERLKGVVAWKTWFVTKGQTAKLKLPLAEPSALLGRTLITSHQHSLVIEFDAERQERWRTKVPNPGGCQGLPNGHRLVTSYLQSAVIEFDADGKEIWRKDRLPSPPHGVERLDNGNTLVVCADAHQLLEISPDGAVKTQTIHGRPLSASRLENGNTLVALQQGNRVVEIAADGEIVWEARNLNGPCDAQRLETGATLVVQMLGNKVVEFDASGKQIVWSTTVALENPTAARRLEDGRTLVTDNKGLHEIDAEGKQILRSHQRNNVIGLSHF